MFQTSVVEKYLIAFSRKSCRLWDTVEKHDRAG